MRFLATLALALAAAFASPSFAGEGAVGKDFSANKPALPVVGANFGATGPWANYVLTAVVPASSVRFLVDVENISGSQVVVVTDDGTAAQGAAPVNASPIVIGGGSGIGTQGGSYVEQTFRGRVQIYSPITTALTFTGALTGATSGTLNAAWTGATSNPPGCATSCVTYVTFSDGSVQGAILTNGSTAVTWSEAVTATASASAATAFITATQR